MEHIKMVAILTGATVGFFSLLTACIITPFWMAAAAGIL